MNNFYSPSPFEQPILDHLKYKGRGRPRKTDYSPIVKIQKDLNSIRNMVINRKGFYEENRI